MKGIKTNLSFATLSLAALGFLALSGRAAAWQQEGGTTKPKPAAEPATAKTPAASDNKGPAAGSDADKLGPRFEANIAKLNKLRRMMDEKLELSPAQRGTIGRLLDTFISELKENKAIKKRSAPKQPSTIYPKSVPQLEEDLKKAQADNDTEKMEKIRQQIGQIKREPPTPMDDETAALFEKLRDELKPDQKEKFEKVVARWKAITPRGPRTGPFQQLRRAVMDPEVELTEAQKTGTEAIFNETLRVVRLDGERDPAKVADAVDEAKAKVFEKLTPEQQAKVNANLKMFRAEEKGYDESKFRGPKAVKKPVEKAKGDGDKPADDK